MHWLIGLGSAPIPPLHKRSICAWRLHNFFVIRQGVAMSATSANSPLSGGSALTRKPQRLTITISWSVHQSLIEASIEQGRSISNMAAYWLERQSELG